MQWQLLWYVLAGLIIGFTASTLWEWLYFRRKRMDLRDQRLIELETELRLTREQLYDLRAQAPPPPVPPAADYQSPGIFLESEEAESLRDEGYAPVRDVVYVDRESESLRPAPSVYEPAPPPTFIATEKPQPMPSTVTTAATAVEIVDEKARGEEEDATRQRAVAAALGGVAVGAVAAEAMQARGEGAEEIEEVEPGVIEGEAGEAEAIVTEPAIRGEMADEEAVRVEVIDIESEEAAAVTLAEEEPEALPESLAPDAGEGEGAEAEVTEGEALGPEEEAAVTLAEEEPETLPESLAPDAGEGEGAEAEVTEGETAEPEAIVGEPVADAASGEGKAVRADAGDVKAIDSEEPAASDPFAILGWRPTRSPDDLTLIKGIGKRYSERLYNAGVYTFAELAAADPEELRQATRAMRTVDIESWRRQAQELAAESGRENVRYFGPRPDDLTAIKGISPQIMRQLYQRGIATYTQLAHLSERQLAEDLADLGVAESPDLRTWLVKADELAREKLDSPQGDD